MLPTTVMLNWTATTDNYKQSVKRWERDLVLLQREYELHPNDARTAFYLAQTYGSLNMHEEAQQMYAVRVGITPAWEEETFMAMLRRGEQAYYAGHSWPEVMELYLQAWNFRPSRAEPLHLIAKHYHEQGNMSLCALFAMQAYKVPYPPSHSLFVYKQVYGKSPCPALV